MSKEEISIELPEEAKDDVVTQPELTINLDQDPEGPKPKNVKIQTNEDHRCFNGKWYTFKKGVDYYVPQNVKDVLKKAGILQAI